MGNATKKAAHSGGLLDSLQFKSGTLPHHDPQAQEAEAQEQHRAGLGDERSALPRIDMSAAKL
jgi:hypothetical protein